MLNFLGSCYHVLNRTTYWSGSPPKKVEWDGTTGAFLFNAAANILVHTGILSCIMTMIRLDSMKIFKTDRNH